MIKLNLLPPQEKNRLNNEQLQRWIIFYGVYLWAILLIFAFLMSFVLLYINLQMQSAAKNLTTTQSSLKGTDLKTQQEKQRRLILQLKKSRKFKTAKKIILRFWPRSRISRLRASGLMLF